MSYNYNCNCGSGMMETDMPWPGMPIPQMYPAGAPCDGGAYAPAVRPVPSASPAPLSPRASVQADQMPVLPAPSIPAVPETESAQPQAVTSFCPDRFPVGMGYVPVQKWEAVYSADRALKQGTIFPALDLEFMRRCG